MKKIKTHIACFLFALYYLLPAQAQDVWINEIYADQTPSFGMPNAEFLELKNNTNDTFTLDGWSLSDASDTVSIPFVKILPHGYLILCKTSAENQYASWGHAIGVPSFPSLNNAGDAVKIWNELGQLIDSVTYEKDFYQNEMDSLGNEKSDGGYSLERLATTSLCGTIYNWLPCRDSHGASPGQANSILGVTIPAIHLEVQEVQVDNDTTLRLVFNQEFPYFSEQNVFLEGNVIKQATLDSARFVSLILQETLIPNEYYTITFSVLHDCRGNLTHLAEYSFYFYDEINPGDLVINEILFNPLTGGVDFIEIYNQTGKRISLEDFEWMEYDAIFQEEIKENMTISNLEIGPFEFHVFTTDTSNIKLQYDVFEPRWLHEDKIPNLPDDEGIIVLRFPDGRKMDSVNYQSTWHLSKLDLEDGVSLERINVGGPSNIGDNWHSAAKTFGYATPTGENSQNLLGTQKGSLTVYPEIFTPNEDGDKDFCLINYKTDKPGEIATINIYDAQGRHIQVLAQNHSLGRDNSWKWTGLTNEYERAPIGIYLVLLEIFTENGRKEVYKSEVVLGTRFN